MRPQTLTFEGCRNLRDIGGCVTRDGRTVRTGAVFRSGSLHLAKGSDLKTVTREISPRTVIDFRTKQETENFPIDLAGIGAHYMNLPLLRQATGGTIDPDQPIPTLDEIYASIVRESVHVLVDFMRALTKPQAIPAIMFCAAGKDRTGVAAALLLGTLDVDDEAIVADYALTGRVDPTGLGEGYAERLAFMPPEFHDSAPETMRGFLNAVRREHGSVLALMTKAGLGLDDLSALERILLISA